MAAKDFVMDPISKRCSVVTGVLASRSARPKAAIDTGPWTLASASVRPGAFMARMYSAMNLRSGSGGAAEGSEWIAALLEGGTAANAAAAGPAGVIAKKSRRLIHSMDFCTLLHAC